MSTAINVANKSLLYLAMNRNAYTANLRSGSKFTYAPLLGTGAILYVSKSGSDSNTGASLAQAFLTIEKAMLTVQSGGTIVVYSSNGTLTEYSDVAANVAPFGTSYGSNPACPYPDGDIRSVIIPRVSGTLGNNCTIMAAPGHEGLVQITGSTYVMGMHMHGQSYWTVWGLRFVGCFKHGIYSSEATIAVDANSGLYIANPSSVSYGCTIENCLVKNTYADGITFPGIDNTSGISPWGAKGWTIRNCAILNTYDLNPAKLNSAIQTYAQAELTIENVLIDSDRGIFIKDHWLEVQSPRTPYAKECEIRYSKIRTKYSAFYIGNKGATTPESGGQSFHHNLCIKYGDGTEIDQIDKGVFISARQILAAAKQATNLSVYNNIFDTGTQPLTKVVEAGGWKSISMKGNINIVDSYQYFLTSPNDGATLPENNLTYSDENVFVTATFQQKLQKYWDAGELTVSDFNAWKALTIGSPNARTLQMNNPDSHSMLVATSTGLFNNQAAGDYTPKIGSPAIGRMLDGSNAGPYQYGTETVGLFSTYTAGV